MSCCRLRDTDLEIDRAGEGVGDRRPLLDMGDQRIDLVRRDPLTFHVDLDAHVGEADRLVRDVARAPTPRGVEITLPPVPQTAVMLRSPSSSSSSLLTIQPRCTALACSPTARQEPSAASEASDGLGAVSSPRSPGSSTM